MGYDARIVANEFLRIARNNGRTLTNMQVQKLVYIAHGYALAIYGPALVNQIVEAWRYGPVIPTLYTALREYGAGVVTGPVATLSRDSISDAHRSLLSTVHSAYGRFSGPQLSTMTHKAGTPWAEVYRPNVNNIEIPNDLIRRYYRRLLDEREGIHPPA